MQRLEVSGAVRHIYIYVIRRQRVNRLSENCEESSPSCDLPISVQTLYESTDYCKLMTEIHQ
jgi:hypothetical protein